VSTVLLDTHAVLWWSVDYEQLSEAAIRAVESAEEIAVASVSWYELAWMIQNRRVTVDTPLRLWLNTLAAQVRTVTTTPDIATTAASLPGTFPGDPADRVIYATALEYGWPLVTKDQRMRRHVHPAQTVVW
jgi:PIN domain nuclease of toxin-antitoxin system